MFKRLATYRPSGAARICAVLAALACAAGFLCTGCAAGLADSTTLYQRLGGNENLVAVTDRTVDRAASEPQTRRSFEGVKLSTLKASIVQHLCAISGGGCLYEGETMANAHRDSHIAPSEFDALVNIMREEFDRTRTDPAAKNELLRLLAPMKREIVANGDEPAASGHAR